MSEKRYLPAFASEAEEAQWWFDHREEHGVEFVQAIREGRITNGSKRRIAVAQSTPILLDADEASIALVLASNAGLDYADYVKQLLHDALLREAATSIQQTERSGRQELTHLRAAS